MRNTPGPVFSNEGLTMKLEAQQHADTAVPRVPASPDWQAGTLRYSQAGLVKLFAVLLIGNFSITFLDRVIPSVLPIQLGDLKAPNWLIAVIMTSIPTAIATVASPFIGYISDRLRTKLGRRIPFILTGAPFAALFLIILAFAPKIAARLTGTQGILSGQVDALYAVLSCIALSMAGFKFFELVNSMSFTYLINDVVPSARLTRFYALAQITTIAAAAIFNFFIFKYAKTHLPEIFVGSGILYGAGSLLVCIFVKEGTYPPVPADQQKVSFLASAKIFFKECFSHRIYWFYFLHTACWNLGGASALFTVLLNLSLGITLEQFGFIQGTAMILTCLLLYPAGALSDRLHPLRVMLWVKTGLLISTIFSMIWLVRSFSPQVNFAILVGITALTLPLTVLYTAAFNPMIMRILPASRFGQFTSACVMLLSVFSIFSGFAVGAFFDVIRKMFPAEKWGNDYCYRFIPVWSFFFFAIGLVFLILLFREWKRLGGDKSYKPPLFD